MLSKSFHVATISFRGKWESSFLEVVSNVQRVQVQVQGNFQEPGNIMELDCRKLQGHTPTPRI